MEQQKNYYEETTTDPKTGKVTVKTVETHRYEEKKVKLPFGLGFTRRVEIKDKPENGEEQSDEEKAKKKTFWRRFGIGLVLGGAAAAGGKVLYDHTREDEGEDEDDEDYEDYDEDDEEDTDDEEEE